ncbi:hypothetical protein [Candidatus Rariloculus sp.]|uniref:hypothetical protein n=1 Tax=Candidatus Rariloculus sp. TaxID=3101265 RepID=UPI003D12EF0A
MVVGLFLAEITPVPTGNETSPLDDGQRVWTPLKVTAGACQSGDGTGTNRMGIGTLQAESGPRKSAGFERQMAAGLALVSGTELSVPAGIGGDFIQSV